MSAKVIQFPNANERIAQMIDEIVDAKLTHDNPQVLDCLKVEMKRYGGYMSLFTCYLR